MIELTLTDERRIFVRPTAIIALIPSLGPTEVVLGPHLRLHVQDDIDAIEAAIRRAESGQRR